MVFTTEYHILTTSQNSGETLFRWSGKYIILWQIYSRK